MHSLIRAIACFLLTSSVLVACLPLDPNAAPRVPAGWVLYDQDEDGWVIALPSTWREADWENPSWQTALERTEVQNPQIAGIGEARRRFAATDMLRFFAIDGASSEGFTVNLIVIRDTLGKHASVADYLASGVATMSKQPATRMTRVLPPIETESGRAEVAEMENVLTTDSGSFVGNMIQYLVGKDRQVYALSFTAGGWQIEHYRDVFREIVRSFRFVSR